MKGVNLQGKITPKPLGLGVGAQNLNSGKGRRRYRRADYRLGRDRGQAPTRHHFHVPVYLYSQQLGV
jgi:hypothetical protein